MGADSGRIVVDVTHDVAGSDAAAGTFLATVSVSCEVGFLVMASFFLKCQCLACSHQPRLLDATRIAAIAIDHRKFSSFSLWAARYSTA